MALAASALSVKKVIILLLSDHAYNFVSNRDEFYKTNAAIFAQLKNAVIEEVFAVWDRIGKAWFYDAPMLVKTPAGVLSVHVKSDEYIAIGWNDISPLEKPQWLDEATARGLGLEEDLEWRPYDKARPACGERIGQVLFHPCVGIGLQCASGLCLWLYDAGDVIAARVDEAKKQTPPAVTPQNTSNKEKNAMLKPKHLEKIFHPLNEDGTEGEIICECGCRAFKIRYFGEFYAENKLAIDALEDKSGQAVRAVCADCGADHLLYDFALYGYDGLICETGAAVPDDRLKTFTAGTDDRFAVKMALEYDGEEQFLEEIVNEETLKEQFHFTLADRANVWSWVVIDLKGVSSGTVYKDFVNEELA